MLCITRARIVARSLVGDNGTAIYHSDTVEQAYQTLSNSVENDDLALVKIIEQTMNYTKAAA